MSSSSLALLWICSFATSFLGACFVSSSSFFVITSLVFSFDSSDWVVGSVKDGGNSSPGNPEPK